MRFSTRTGLKLDKVEERRLILAHDDLVQIARITDSGKAKNAVEYLREALVELDLAKAKCGVVSPSGDTSDPMPPSQSPKTKQ